MERDGTERGRAFADLVYAVLVAEKRYAIEAVAAALGLTYHTLYARIRNRIVFSADEVRRLIEAAPDPRFVAYLLRGTPYVAADRVSGTDAAEAEAIHRGATRIVIEATDVLEVVERALGDGRVDHRDALLIRTEIEIAERALASLRMRLRAAAPAVAGEL